MLKAILRISKKISTFLFPDNEVEEFFSNSGSVSRVAHARTTLHPWILAVLDYRDTRVRRAIRILKTRKSPTLVPVFGSLLYDFLQEELADRMLFAHFKNPILVPIPVTRRRLHERGFNQSQALAQALCSYMKDATFAQHLLIKVRETKKQAHIRNRRKRLTNVRDCFQAQACTEIRGKNIILVDDVTTTGATFIEARRILLQAGARNVIAIAVAH